MTPEQKDHALFLIDAGDKLEAVRYLQQTLNVNAEQALALTEKLEEESGNNELLNRFNELKSKLGSKPSTRFPRIVGLAFMSIGLIMLSAVAFLAYRDYQFSLRAIPVTGKVTANESYYSSDSDGGGTTMYTPTFEYSFNGAIHTHKSNVSSSEMDYSIGESVEILVNPDDPQQILVNEFWERWTLPLILGFLGLMFSGLGYMAYRLFGNT